GELTFKVISVVAGQGASEAPCFGALRVRIFLICNIDNLWQLSPEGGDVMRWDKNGGHTENLTKIVTGGGTPFLLWPPPHLIPQVIRGAMVGRCPCAHKGTHRDCLSQWYRATSFIIAVHSVSECFRRTHNILNVRGEFLPLCTR